MATIIKDVASLKEILGGIQKDMSEKVWMPFVRQGEKRFILKEIGEDFYDELTEITNPTGVNQKLIDKLKDASAHYASMSSNISIILSTGDIGLMQNKSANSVPITKWQYVVKVKEDRAKADAALEDALKFLQKNKASFETYLESEEYKATQNLLIPTANALTNYLPVVDNSQIFYSRLTKYIAKQQQYWIKPLVGSAQLEAWKAKARQASPDWTEEESEALDLLCHALSNKAFAEAIPFLNLNSDFRIVAETDGVLNEDDLTPDRKTGLQSTAIKQADEFVGRLIKYLNAKASDEIFTEFFTSDFYKPSVNPLDKLPPADEAGFALWL